MKNTLIDYDFILSQAPMSDEEGIIQYLSEVLPDEWCEKYREMTPTKTNILQFNDSHFEYLFDHSSELVAKGVIPEEHAVEDRVIVVFGKSQPSIGKRDTSRMRGFLGGPLRDSENVHTDKGHFMGHASGGGLDVNLFPQRTDINRGWSERGKIYRAMERYCAQNAGTFCFSRPFYSDRTWRPTKIEFGLLKKDKTLWVERFEN